MNAKRNIAISCLSIAMCASIIVGATYSVYTSKDEVKATISSGGVNVQAEVTGVAAYYTDETDYAAGTVSGSKAEGWSGTFAPANAGSYGSFTYNAGGLTLTNFAPGDKIELTMDIVNYSTISMKYQMQVLATSGWVNSGLATQLDVSIDNEQIAFGSHGTYSSEWSDRIDPKAEPETLKTVNLVISLPMGIDAEGSCELSISVNAVQGNVSGNHIVNSYQQLVDAIEAATDGERITIGSDLEVPEALEITADIELDLNGHTISNSEGGHTISVVNNSKLTISGGTVSNSISGKSALYVEAGSEAVINGGTFIRKDDVNQSNHYVIENYGHMEINGGTFYHEYGALGGTITLVANKDGGTMVINGGEFSGMNIAVKNEKADLTINGGTFDAIDGTGSNYGQSLQNYGNATITGGEFLKYITSLADSTTQINGGRIHKTISSKYIQGTFTITGGSFDMLFQNIYISDGYVLAANKEGTIDVTAGEALAYGMSSATSTVVWYNFASLQDAIDCYVINGSGTCAVRMNADVNDSVVVPASVSLTLYMRGHTITNMNTPNESTITIFKQLNIVANENGLVKSVSEKAALYIASGGTGIVRGTNSVESQNNHAVESYGTLNLYGATINGNVLIAGGGTLSSGEINGTVIVTETGKPTFSGSAVNGNMTNYGTTTISGGTINGTMISEEGGTTTITGGTFANEPAASDIAEGYESVLGEDGKWSVVAK